MRNARSMFDGLVTTLLIAATLGTAHAQWKPEKNVEIVVGLAPGSFQDHTGRMLQTILQDHKLLPVTSSVANRIGANGAVGWAYMARQAGDPHYVMILSPTILTANITGGTQYNYSDFTPLAMLSSQYVALAVNAGSAIRDGQNLLDRLKKDVSSVAFADNGMANNLHILVVLVAKSAGADVKRLKVAIFQGGGELTTALLGGHVDVISTATSNVLPHVQSGKLRIVGIASPRRLAGALAQVPTWKEQGVDVVVPNWSGIMGPKNLTAAQIAWWDETIGKVVKTDEWKTDLERNFQEHEYLPSAEANAFLRSQHAQLKAALTDIGLAK
jgi:putative tricarboxylic transport membrane protein